MRTVDPGARDVPEVFNQNAASRAGEPRMRAADSPALKTDIARAVTADHCLYGLDAHGPLSATPVRHLHHHHLSTAPARFAATDVPVSSLMTFDEWFGGGGGARYFCAARQQRCRALSARILPVTSCVTKMTARFTIAKRFD